MVSEREAARQAASAASTYGLRKSLEWELQHPSGVMGDREIAIARELGQIVIEPFEDDLLKSSSYDVRLGGNFYVAEQVGHKVDFSPYAEHEVEEYYRGPLKAIQAGDWCKEHSRRQFPGIDPEEMVIVLRPGECILAHTVEFIGAVENATTMMKARSSLGRINISSCDDAGWGDVGYINRWTMEIRNKNSSVWVPLVVGMPIAQMVFLHVAESSRNYAGSGHYQTGADLTMLQLGWSPEMMLPKLWSEENKRVRQLLKGSELVW